MSSQSIGLSRMPSCLRNLLLLLLVPLLRRRRNVGFCRMTMRGSLLYPTIVELSGSARRRSRSSHSASSQQVVRPVRSRNHSSSSGRRADEPASLVRPRVASSGELEAGRCRRAASKPAKRAGGQPGRLRGLKSSTSLSIVASAAAAVVDFVQSRRKRLPPPAARNSPRTSGWLAKRELRSSRVRLAKKRGLGNEQLFQRRSLPLAASG